MDRFARHRALVGFGEDGQGRLAGASALVVGVGGLGCPAALYLAAAGVGRITLCDPGIVDAPDLHRQVLFGASDLGRPKADAAAQRLAAAYPDTEVQGTAAPFDAGLVADHDVVIDGTDEPGTRGYVHEACVQGRVPLVWGSLEGWEAQWATVVPDGPCLRCMWPAPGDAPACEDVGVFGPLAGIAGTVMASEATRVLLGMDVLSGRLLLLDGRTMRFEEIPFARRPQCACCAPTK